MTLTEQASRLRVVAGARGPGGVEQHNVILEKPSTCVSAIIVLFALPRLLTGATLAHEAMHAWLRLSGVLKLPLDVEEGLC